MNDVIADGIVAAEIAERAGRLLLELRDSGLPGHELGTEGDKRSHDCIVAALADSRPDDAVLSEEGPSGAARPGAGRVWIVDPLDGTREYSENGRTDWAVHVALVAAGELVAGAVALPARGMTLSTANPPRRPATRDAGALRLLVSRTRPLPLAEKLAVRTGATLVPMGSAGAKAMAVVLGEGDVYAHAGGQYVWDSAAPVAVAAAAGLHVSRLDGSPLRYDQPDPWLPDLLVCQQEDAGSVLEAVRGLDR